MIPCQYCKTDNRSDAIYCNTCGGLLKPGAAPPRGYRGPSTLPVHLTGQLPAHCMVAGHYLILRLVGEGGMAAVYQATDTANGRNVAIKEMSQDGLTPDEVTEALDAFKFEADTLMRLRHPNLPRVYEHFYEGSRHFLVMDFIDGQTLEQLLRANGGPLPEAEVLAIADQLCDVLAYLHGRTPPIIFRDLKPGNVMVARGGQVKLIDFGIARFFTPGRQRDTQALGTPGYAPPEQYGKAQTDPRADIYALGATLYHLVTNYDPATSPFSLPPIRTKPNTASPALQRAIEKAISLDREQRYPTVAALKADLRAAKVGAPPVMASQRPQQYTAPRVPVASPAMGTAQPSPRLIAKPGTVAFGQMTIRRRVKRTFTVEGFDPNGDKVLAVPLAPWLTAGVPRMRGPMATVEVTADTKDMFGPGAQQTAVRITQGRHALMVPVTAELVPASSLKSNAPTWPGSLPTPRAPRIAPRHMPRANPYAAYYATMPQTPPKKFNAVRLAISWALALLLSAAAMYFVPLALQHVGIMSQPPGWFMTTLLLCAAAIGAVIGQTASPWLGRGRASFIFSFTGLLASFLLPPLGLPESIGGSNAMGPLLMATGAALGSEYAVGHAVLSGIQFVFTRARWMITVATMIIGGLLGLKLGGPFFGWVLLFFGVFFGWLAGLTLNGIIGRMTRTAP